MKYLFATIFFLCTILSTQAMAGRSYHLEIEFNFQDAYIGKTLKGFRVFQEGKKICEVPNPYARYLECDFYSEVGMYEFSIAPYYTDNSTGKHSAPCEVCVGSTNVSQIVKVLLL